MSEALSKYETETVIVFSNGSPTATVYTCNRRIMTNCVKRGYTLIAKDSFSKTFECPKRAISFRSAIPKPRKPMTEEAKLKLKESRMTQTTLDFTESIVTSESSQ